MKETLERKEMNLQKAETLSKEYEKLLAEISAYDSYAQLRLRELNVILLEENEIPITSVVSENKQLK